jgi:hypothetical protein
MTHSVDARLFVNAVAGLDWGALVLGGERQGLCPRWESPATCIGSIKVAAAMAVACDILQRR